MPGSYHTKISIGLYNIYAVTKKKVYLSLANKIINKSVNSQKKDGKFITGAGYLNLHPHCYAAEGIWVAANIFKKKSYYKSVILAIEWIKKNMKGDLPPRLFFKNNKIVYNYRVDAVSQFLRLMLVLNIDKKTDANSHLEKNLLTIILKNQSKSKKKVLNGGFYWGKQSDGKQTYCVNAWTSAFVVQGLVFLEQIRKAKKQKLIHFI